MQTVLLSSYFIPQGAVFEDLVPYAGLANWKPASWNAKQPRIPKSFSKGLQKFDPTPIRELQVILPYLRISNPGLNNWKALPVKHQLW